jgi:hypothetical protein
MQLTEAIRVRAPLILRVLVVSRLAAALRADEESLGRAVTIGHLAGF